MHVLIHIHTQIFYYAISSMHVALHAKGLSSTRCVYNVYVIHSGPVATRVAERPPPLQPECSGLYIMYIHRIHYTGVKAVADSVWPFRWLAKYRTTAWVLHLSYIQNENRILILYTNLNYLVNNIRIKYNKPQSRIIYLNVGKSIYLFIFQIFEQLYKYLYFIKFQYWKNCSVINLKTN